MSLFPALPHCTPNLCCWRRDSMIDVSDLSGTGLNSWSSPQRFSPVSQCPLTANASPDLKSILCFNTQYPFSHQVLLFQNLKINPETCRLWAPLLLMLGLRPLECKPHKGRDFLLSCELPAVRGMFLAYFQGVIFVEWVQKLILSI